MAVAVAVAAVVGALSFATRLHHPALHLAHVQHQAHGEVACVHNCSGSQYVALNVGCWGEGGEGGEWGGGASFHGAVVCLSYVCMGTSRSRRYPRLPQPQNLVPRRHQAWAFGG